MAANPLSVMLFTNQNKCWVGELRSLELTKVKCLGTEDRPNPMKDEIYEFKIFRGADIKSIDVLKSPKGTVDFGIACFDGPHTIILKKNEGEGGAEGSPTKDSEAKDNVGLNKEDKINYDKDKIFNNISREVLESTEVKSLGDVDTKTEATGAIATGEMATTAK